MNGHPADLPFHVVEPVGELSPEQGQVLAVLSVHRGRREAISVADLAETTGIDGRRLQQVVKHLVERHRVPIGTATRRPFGYYVIQSDEERRATRNSHMRRALSTIKRARAYDRGGWVDDLVGQIEMGLGSSKEAMS